MSLNLPAGVQITAPIHPRFDEILTHDALALVAKLHRAFEGRRQELLKQRIERQTRIDAGEMPDFLPETRHIREGDWKIAPLPKALECRRTEITGPVERKMIINAYNSGADSYMTDFEDSNSPNWYNQIQGQVNLKDAIRREISYINEVGKEYRLNDEIATLQIRPRGWHLDEKHVLVDGQRVSGGIFDFGLAFFHNAREQIARGAGPFYYLPKMESHLEARLWNDIFVMAQNECGIPQGTIKATVLIETILATFEMEEILYELREHSAGLNAGRWDYIFSCIKKFKKNKNFCLANRGAITMEVPFMRAYALHLVKVCHKRGAPAMAMPGTASTAAGWPIPAWCPSPTRNSSRCWATSRTSGKSSAMKCSPPRISSTSNPSSPLPKLACAITSTSASTTWVPGWLATAACRSTI